MNLNNTDLMAKLEGEQKKEMREEGKMEVVPI